MTLEIFNSKTSIVIIGVILKVIYVIWIYLQNRLHQNYKLAKEIFDDIQNNPSMHPYVLERGYQALAKSKNIKIREAEYLTSLENPNSSLTNYIKARSYLLFYPDKEKKVEFQKKYETKFPRQIRKAFHMSLYWVFGFIAIFPIFFLGVLVPNKEIWTSALVIGTFLSSFGTLSFFALDDYFIIKRAEELVENQKIYSPQKIKKSPLNYC